MDRKTRLNDTLNALSRSLDAEAQAREHVLVELARIRMDLQDDGALQPLRGYERWRETQASVDREVGALKTLMTDAASN